MRWLITILILASTPLFAQNPLLRRICQDPNNNTLFWANPVYPCATFHFYIIWASDDNIVFYPVDTNFTAGSESHIHLNATIPGIPNKYYFLERRDSCGPVYNHYSDTLETDLQNPPATFLDSVSVDINTNKVILGWQGNKLPDFNRYFTYKVIVKGPPPSYASLDPLGLKDTFQTDNTGSDPSAGSIEYDINTTDSCENPSIFDINPHATIHLKSSIDTCSKKITLNWSHYKGWNSILKYYIYQDTGTNYVLIDSVNGSINSYIHTITLGLTYKYYVRAIKDASIVVSSSSNSTQIITRKRVDASYVSLSYVSSDPTTKSIIINFSSDPLAETKGYNAYIYSNDVFVSTLNYSSNDMNKNLNTGLNWEEKFRFQIEAFDFCDIATRKSDSSVNIVLNGEEKMKRSIFWNSYFTWNTGVQKYIIYRGTGEGSVYSFTNWHETTDTFAIDSGNFDNAEANGVCYYIEAIKNGAPDIVSKSNIFCIPIPFIVFFPNAFVPTGVNSLFRPGGGSIDYESSTIQIYDRWGQMVHSSQIKGGWDGTDLKGQPCVDGLYYYKANMVSIKNEKTIKNGSVTLLR